MAFFGAIMWHQKSWFRVLMWVLFFPISLCFRPKGKK